MDYKTLILQKLMYKPNLRFSDLQIKSLTSKHFNYYLHLLVEEDLIQKQGKLYQLTAKGKDLVGRMDEKSLAVERQPKISVAIYPERTNDKGEVEYLLTKRLKQPYYGKVGGFTGKLRFGETFEEAAKRELMEESGLAGDFKMVFMARKMAFDPKSEVREFMQDNIYIFFLVRNLSGTLIEKNDEQENFWCKYEDISDREDLFNTLLQFIEWTRTKKIEIPELIVEAEGY